MENEEFRKLLIKRAFCLAREVIALVDKFPNKRSAWIIGDQLIRAATSIGANIWEKTNFKLIIAILPACRQAGTFNFEF